MTIKRSGSAFDSAAFLTVAAVFRTLIAFAYTVLAVRALGAVNFGKFSLVMAYGITFLASYSGIYPVITSRLVETRGLPDDERRREQATLLSAAAMITLPGAMILLAAGVIGFAATSSIGDIPRIVAAGTMFVICQLVTSLCGALLDGFGRLRTSAIVSMSSVTVLTGFLLFESLAHRTVALNTFLLWSGVAYLIEAAVALVVTAAGVWRLRGGAERSRRVRELLREGFNLQTAKIMGLTLDPISKTILTAFAGPASVAVYDLANKAAGGLQTVFSAYSRLFLQIARHAVDERLSSGQQAAEYSWALFFYAAAAVSVLGVLPASQWLHLNAIDLGAGFILSALMQWLFIVATLPYLSLMSFGQYRFILRNQTILAVSSAVAGLVLVPLIGLAGAFVGALLATVLNVVLIERRFSELVPGYRGTVALARAMGGRLLCGVMLLIVPTLVLPHLHEGSIYWSVTAAFAVVILVMVLREPLMPVLLRLVRPRVA